jgi:hypothetical protein
VVSFTPQQLYSRGKSPRFQLGRSLHWPQTGCWRRGEEKNLALTGTRTPTIGSPDCSQSLHRLHCTGSSEILRSLIFWVDGMMSLFSGDNSELRSRSWSTPDKLVWNFYCSFSIWLEQRRQPPYLILQFEKPNTIQMICLDIRFSKENSLLLAKKENVESKVIRGNCKRSFYSYWIAVRQHRTFWSPETLKSWTFTRWCAQ